MSKSILVTNIFFLICIAERPFNLNAIAFERLDLLDVDNYVARCDMEIIISVINHVGACMQQQN
jgi:hypothetical protein